jgi:hypothetical protein
MVVTAEKPSPLPRNYALSFACLHRSSASSKLPVCFPSLLVGSFASPQSNLCPPGPCYPQTQSPQKRVHRMHTML